MHKKLILSQSHPTDETNIMFNGRPEHIGPGVWYSIHILAKNSTDKESVLRFVKFINIIRDNFPCHKCRYHIKEYLDTHKIDHYLKIHGLKNGVFKYTWEFHNDVNKRVGKPILSWENVLKIYYSQENIQVCDLNCSVNDKKLPITPAKK